MIIREHARIHLDKDGRQACNVSTKYAATRKLTDDPTAVTCRICLRVSKRDPDEQIIESALAYVRANPFAPPGVAFAEGARWMRDRKYDWK